MLVNANGQRAQHVVIDLFLTLELGDGIASRGDVEQAVVAFADKLDLVLQAAKPPIFGLLALAAVVGDDLGERFGQTLDLRGRDILTRNKNMFV